MVYEDTIDGKLLYKMLLGGFDSLSRNKNYLNDLNIFPVSDNDTGTNMKNTFEKGISALKDEVSFHNVISDFVKDMLLGSRGNSGFILSQYFLGIREYTKDKKSVTLIDLSAALQQAYGVAYRAVLQPAEGTMLTIMRDGINRTLPKINDKTLVKEFFDILVEEMFICTQETVKQMNILRENNVVDSGALGLYLVFDGMRKALHNDTQYLDCEQNDSFPKRSPSPVKSVSFFRYCTEFVLKMHDIKCKEFFVRLIEKRGDSIVVAIDEDILKIHIHTNVPQEILDEFAEYGNIAVKKIDDLFLTQEFERLKQRKHKGFAVVAFAYGEGNAAILEQMGADVAFCVPCGYFPAEDELKMLLDGFLKENLIVFPCDKETQERLKRIKWFSNLQNLHVVESDGLPKTFFTISSLIFADKFQNVVKSLERLKKLRCFQTSVNVAIVENRIQYAGFLKDKSIIRDNLIELLNATANEDILKLYSTLIVFGGKYCKPKDVDSVCAYFEKNSDVSFTYFDGQQHDCDFIIGAL